MTQPESNLEHFSLKM